jgi:hypothetical protein
MVAGVSGTSGRSRARSVRSVSARTNASNRSSLAPAAPNRGPQVLHLPGGDHHHCQAGGQQGIDQRAVAALDGDLGDLVPAQPGGHRGDPGLVVRGGEPAGDPPGHVDHARRMIGGGPVDPGARAASRDIGQNQG